MPQMSPMNWMYMYVIFFSFGCYFFFMVWYFLNLTIMKKEKVNMILINYYNKW